MPVITHNSSRKSAECTKGGTDCHVLARPGTLEAKGQGGQKSRHGYTSCLAGLSKRNRILVRIIVVLIVGIAVGIGFGVSNPRRRHLAQRGRNS